MVAAIASKESFASDPAVSVFEATPSRPSLLLTPARAVLAATSSSPSLVETPAAATLAATSSSDPFAFSPAFFTSTVRRSSEALLVAPAVAVLVARRLRPASSLSFCVWIAALMSSSDPLAPSNEVANPSRPALFWVARLTPVLFSSAVRDPIDALLSRPAVSVFMARVPRPSSVLSATFSNPVRVSCPAVFTFAATLSRESLTPLMPLAMRVLPLSMLTPKFSPVCFSSASSLATLETRFPATRSREALLLESSEASLPTIPSNPTLLSSPAVWMFPNKLAPVFLNSASKAFTLDKILLATESRPVKENIKSQMKKQP